MDEFIFMERVLDASSPKYQSVRFSKKHKIDFCEREIRINSRSFPSPVNKLPSKLIQSKQSDSYLSEKYEIGPKMGQTGRSEIKHRFPVTKEVCRRRFMGWLWLCRIVALVSFALETLSHLKAHLKPFCNHLLVDLLTN